MRKTNRRLSMGEEAWEALQKAKRVQKVVKYRKKLKLRLIAYKGGKCQRCGYDKLIPGAYDFHHRDPSKKEFGLAQSYGKSWLKLTEEVDKCDLLCRNCHAEIHDEDYS